MSQVYDKMDKGTLLVVVCQGTVSRMTHLLARRTKSKWAANSKEKQDNVSGQKRARTQGEKCLPLWLFFSFLFFSCSGIFVFILTRTVRPKEHRPTLEARVTSAT